MTSLKAQNVVSSSTPRLSSATLRDPEQDVRESLTNATMSPAPVMAPSTAQLTRDLADARGRPIVGPIHPPTTRPVNDAQAASVAQRATSSRPEIVCGAATSEATTKQTHQQTKARLTPFAPRRKNTTAPKLQIAKQVDRSPRYLCASVAPTDRTVV
jgi:hypothetical protein